MVLYLIITWKDVHSMLETKLEKSEFQHIVRVKTLWTWAHWKNYHTIQITDTWHVPNNMFWVVHHDGWLSPCMYWKLVWLNPSPCKSWLPFIRNLCVLYESTKSQLSITVFFRHLCDTKQYTQHATLNPLCSK